ncbi:Glycoside hydrolase family 35 [Penicillium sp. IBT 18751x]|nr:Glycoside hydrolase family 35 [Penicillium sp. IBT 18751x]
MIGGQMDPQRIPNKLWADRLVKARAIGLKTIFCYLYWDQPEATKGCWDSSDNNELAKYPRIA